MTELSYTKSFLSMLAQRPIRLTPDYVEDPRKLPARNPYTLPRTHPEKAKRQRITHSTSASVTLTLKPLRPNPALAPLTLAGTSLSTTVATLKAKYCASLPGSADPSKLKLLLKGKPLSDVKTLSELGFADGEEATITAMLMAGGGASAAPTPVASPPPAEKECVRLLEQEAFWKDLEKWLQVRLGKKEVEEDPKEVLAAFRKAWSS